MAQTKVDTAKKSADFYKDSSHAANAVNTQVNLMHNLGFDLNANETAEQANKLKEKYEKQAAEKLEEVKKLEETANKHKADATKFTKRRNRAAWVAGGLGVLGAGAALYNKYKNKQEN